MNQILLRHTVTPAIAHIPTFLVRVWTMVLCLRKDSRRDQSACCDRLIKVEPSITYLYIHCPLFPIIYLLQAEITDRIMPHKQSQIPSITQQFRPASKTKSSIIMTKSHHCGGPGKGMKGNFRSSNGMCKTHRVQCRTKITKGAVCNVKHLKPEKCPSCGR